MVSFKEDKGEKEKNNNKGKDVIGIRRRKKQTNKKTNILSNIYKEDWKKIIEKLLKLVICIYIKKLLSKCLSTVSVHNPRHFHVTLMPITNISQNIDPLDKRGVGIYF